MRKNAGLRPPQDETCPSVKTVGDSQTPSSSGPIRRSQTPHSGARPAPSVIRSRNVRLLGRPVRVISARRPPRALKLQCLQRRGQVFMLRPWPRRSSLWSSDRRCAQSRVQPFIDFRGERDVQRSDYAPPQPRS